jgi:hypothetical protein
MFRIRDPKHCLILALVHPLPVCSGINETNIHAKTDLCSKTTWTYFLTLGASDEVAPTSPPTALRYTYFTSVGSNFGPILSAWLASSFQVLKP